MGRGDNLQIHARGAIVLSGPIDEEFTARRILEGKFRDLFADLNDPLVCPQFAKTGIAVDYAVQLASASWIRYRAAPPVIAKPIESKPFKAPKAKTFKVPTATARRLEELSKIFKKSRGARRAAAGEERAGIELVISSAQSAHEEKERTSIASAQTAYEEQERSRVAAASKPAPIKVFIQSLDVKYRNPPNAQWKWWARIREEQNTMRPGTFTGGP